MGKMAYVTMAILLGIVAMLPVIVLTPKRADHGYYAIPDGDIRLQGKADVESLQNLEGAGAVVVPSTPFHVGVILAFSFVSALGVYFYFKNKMFQGI